MQAGNDILEGLTARGPTARGPTIRGPTVRGPTAQGDLERLEGLNDWTSIDQGLNFLHNLALMAKIGRPSAEICPKY